VETVDKSQLLTIAAFAKAAGVSRQTVYKRLDKDLTGELTRYLTEVDSVKYLDKAALQFFVSTGTVKGDSQIDSQVDKGIDRELTGYLTAIDTMKAQIDSLQKQLETKDQQILFLQETISGLKQGLLQEQALHADTKTKQLPDTQSETEGAAAPGDPADPETETGGSGTASEPDRATAPGGAGDSEPIKKKNPFARLFDRLKPGSWRSDN
jgi:hypothetical protein